LQIFACFLAGACGGCAADVPGNPLPLAEAITGATFIFDAPLAGSARHEVTMGTDRVDELRRLFDQSHRDPNPAKWVILGDLKLDLTGGAIQSYTIYRPGGVF
jgi:hypothetical protein